MLEEKKQDKITLEGSGAYLLMDEISSSSCRDVSEFIIESNLNAKRNNLTHLTLVINSPGGGCMAGFGLIDLMLGSPLPIHTTAVGCVASMALLIFMAGKKGNRMVSPNTLLMSHQFWGLTFGKEHELIASQKEQALLSDMILNHYSKFTNLSKDEVKKKLLPPHDVWLTPKEAVKYGIADKIQHA